jgi:elongation factor G
MLAEHMLFTAHATERVGSVDSGSAASDFDPLEVRRKISISASVLPLEWKGHKINLIDVPGYPDFIGDLHAVARVAESMIIVCEAKADIDVGFDLAFEVAEDHGLATCVFVNKLERDNADYDGLIGTLRRRFGQRLVQLQAPIGKQAAFNGVLDLLTMRVLTGKDREDTAREASEAVVPDLAKLQEQMMDAAAEGDDDLAMKYLEGEALTQEEIEHGLLMGIENGKVIPVLMGSAASGLGVQALLDRIVGELPSPADVPKSFGDLKLEAKTDGPLAAFVFKSTADPYVGKINYIRVFSGTLKADDQVLNITRDQTERLHNLYFSRGKHQEPATSVSAGDICSVAKLQETHTGDTLTTPKDRFKIPPIEFPDPIYRIAIRPITKSDEDKLGPSLTKILEEDPTLRYVREPALKQEILEGMGDIHLETVIEKLKNRFGVGVSTEEAKVPFRETIKAPAKAQGRHKRQTGGRGQYGDCWIEIVPLERGSGFEFENKVVGGSIPRNYIPAVEKGLREAMDHGYLAGYPVVDVRASVYDGSYHEVDSSEMAFKIAGNLAFRNAAEKAQPTILEPIMNLEVDVPDECVGDVVGDLNGRRGRLQGMDPASPGKTRVRAQVPMATMMRYALDLRSITKGRGRFRQTVSHYEEVPPQEQQSLIQEYAKQRAAQEAEH